MFLNEVINEWQVRMIRDIEINKLNFRYFDGKRKLGPEYDV